MNFPAPGVADFYSKHAATYVKDLSGRVYYGPRVTEFLAARATPGKSLLDIACGPGHLTGDLAATCDVHGVDVASGMIEVAQRQSPQGHYAVHDYHQPFGRAFDLVLFNGGMEFCSDLRRVCRNFAAAIAPGGAGFLSVPLRGPSEPSRDRDVGPLTIHFFSEREVRRALSHAGARVDRFQRGRGWSLRDGRVIDYGYFTVSRA